MNLIFEKIKTTNLKYTSATNLEELTNIFAVLCNGKTAIYYKWYATYKGKQHKINLNRNNNFVLDIFCIDCNKQFQSNVKLSSLFTFSCCDESNLKYSEKYAVRCKPCSNKKNGSETKEKAKQTCLKKYGYECSFLAPDFQERSHKTKQLKYGTNYKQIAQQKGQQKYYEKTGYIHNMRNPECVKLHVVNWKNTFANRTKEKQEEIQIRRLAGYTKTGISTLFGKNNKSARSKISIDFYKNLIQQLEHTICVEEPIGNCIVDFLIPNVCIIEFFGTFWHADPRKYNSTDTIKRGNKEKYHIKAEQIWENDRKKIEFLVEETKLPCIIVWEDDYKRNKEQTINTTIEKIHMCQNKHFFK